MKICTAFFLLILLFFPVPRSEAVTVRAVYDPDERRDNSGFFDDTPLTQAERNSLGPGGSDVATLGEARRRAFERVLCVFENRIRGEFTIRVSAGFTSFAGDSPTLITLAAAAPCHVAAVSETGESGVGYPSALARAVFGEERIGSLCDAYDIEMAFSDRANIFHYGAGAAPRGTVDFAGVAMHEIFHGLGFFDYVEPDGSLLSGTVQDERGEESRTVTLSSVYDLGTYSRADDDFLVNLTDAQRRAAITSGDGLLWGGAAGRRAAATKSSGVAADGKPRLYAPSDYESSSSISHLDLSVHPDDLLEPFHNNSADMTLALALLEDMGWEINAGPLPRSCVPGATSSPSGPTRPPSPAPASQPVLPPIPVPPPLPEPAEAPEPVAMPAPTDAEAGGTTGGGSGGCAVALGGGTTERNIAFADLLLILSVLAPAIFRKETRKKTYRRPDG